jgi:sporulation protein YlmC with PRC-barrel domain
VKLRYRELVGRKVLTSDGKQIGRVVDLRAEAKGESLCITGMLVGAHATLRRLGLGETGLFPRLRTTLVPWDLVERVDERDRVIRLRVAAAVVPTFKEATSTRGPGHAAGAGSAEGGGTPGSAEKEREPA